MSFDIFFPMPENRRNSDDMAIPVKVDEIMTHKSRIYAPITVNPLPDYDCKIDVTLECGSVLIGCNYNFSDYSKSGVAWFALTPSTYLNSIAITANKIKSWRLSK